MSRARSRTAIEALRKGDAARCEELMRSLPEWFGIEESIVGYRRDVEELESLVVRVDDELAGFVTVKRHGDFAAEIVVMAVAKAHHRRGLGRRLVRRVESELARDGVEYLQVKTLGPSRPNGDYATTREFYGALGFRPLEETTAFWGAVNPCLVLVKRLEAEARDR
ncbi:MAG: GNAT family N-acetyltransferase [Acidobacteriota bacterium]|nr:GNAT family N-acetyltransferase [Acidobacteriota bacterium]